MMESVSYQSIIVLQFVTCITMMITIVCTLETRPFNSTTTHFQRNNDHAAPSHTLHHNTGTSLFKPPVDILSKGLKSLAASRGKQDEEKTSSNQSLVLGIVFGLLAVVGIVVVVLVVKFRVLRKVAPTPEGQREGQNGPQPRQWQIVQTV